MRLLNRLFILVLAACLCLIASELRAEVKIPDMPYNHVVDLADIIDAGTESALNGYLLELEQKTTAQMVVLTINSLEGESIDSLSLSIAHDKWKLGQKGRDNGLLLLVSIQDRKYRIETGYGLEGLLPDSFTGSVARDYLVPYFRQGDYSKGITAAALVLINTIADDAGVQITGMPKLRGGPGYEGRRKPGIGGMILSVLVFIGFLYMLIRHPRLLLLLLVSNMLGGGRRGSWGGGGGFGGGGGGGFGGGGSSGGW